MKRLHRQAKKQVWPEWDWTECKHRHKSSHTKWVYRMISSLPMRMSSVLWRKASKDASIIQFKKAPHGLHRYFRLTGDPRPSKFMPKWRLQKGKTQILPDWGRSSHKELCFGQSERKTNKHNDNTLKETKKRGQVSYTNTGTCTMM